MRGRQELPRTSMQGRRKFLTFVLQEFMESHRVVKNSIGNIVSSIAIDVWCLMGTRLIGGGHFIRYEVSNHNVVHLELILHANYN